MRQGLLELACDCTMPTLKVKPDLLEQAASVVGTMLWQLKLVQQSIHGGLARIVALEGNEVAIHDLLRLLDSTYAIRDCKADKDANGFAEPVHVTGSVGKGESVPIPSLGI